MKKYISLLYILTILFIINIFGFVFTARQSATFSTANAAAYDMPRIQSKTTDIVLPTSINFAGEPVPLHRIDVQEALRKELIVNTYLHSHTLQILKTAPRIFTIIEPLLKQAGIPDDFKYLAVIESNLNPKAVSPAQAVGLWQIIEGTAKEAGLEVTKEVDERYHIEKSTIAATNYLKKAYNSFNSWTTAAAAYNAGISMIQKQMGIQKQNNYYDLLLGEETERYIFRILALKQIMTHPELYNFETVQPYPAEKTKIVKVNQAVPDWAEWAAQHHISYKTLKRFNPWLRRSGFHNTNHKTYEIKIPVHPENYK